MIDPLQPNVPFTPQFQDTLDRMTKAQALTHVENVIKKTQEMRNRYEALMLAEAYGSEKYLAHQRCWWLDNNNIVRLQKLHAEIQAEED